MATTWAFGGSIYAGDGEGRVAGIDENVFDGQSVEMWQ